jgi:hypothetical protein
VFLLTRYRLDINDSFGSPMDRSAVPDNLTESTTPPCATSPSLQWQTFDVDFRAPRFDGSRKLAEKARATVLLNGVKIHDNVELGDRKGAAKRLGDAAAGALMLQEHGTAYQFRNIWIVDQTH